MEQIINFETVETEKNTNGTALENGTNAGAVSSRNGHHPNYRNVLEQYVQVPESADLGPVIEKTDIRSSLGPFTVLPGYRIQYPQVVTQALGNLYSEYNEAFRPLVAANTEWDTDYQHNFNPSGTPINRWVQIDMVGLPQGFLEIAADLNETQVRETLRSTIFEIENSLAMYQLLERIFSDNGQETFFKRQFRASLDNLRQTHQRPIALLAVTEQKHNAMRESEFGKSEGEQLSDGEVRDLTGFDRFFGPEEFKRYLEENGDQNEYLLYARTSDPVAKLKKPGLQVDVPLLSDDRTRRIIKASAITFNVDAPGMDHSRRINDTKEYLQPMGMAHAAEMDTHLLDPEFAEYLLSGKSFADYSSERLTAEFAEYLRAYGADPAQVASGEKTVRAKPMKGAYGCYGHLTGTFGERKFRQELRQGLRLRGAYVVQPEMQTPVLVNENDGQTFTYIDRNFFTTDGQEYKFMGGFRSLMPIDTQEAQSGRVHGNGSTVWAEITPSNF